jgi:hypothetical protein
VLSTVGVAATAKGRFREQPWILAVSVGVLFLACLGLARAFGLHGVAWAMILGSSTSLLLYIPLAR